MKILNHACLGDKKEVMGFLLGKFTKDTYIVLDIEPIPAEGIAFYIYVYYLYKFMILKNKLKITFYLFFFK